MTGLSRNTLWTRTGSSVGVAQSLGKGGQAEVFAVSGQPEIAAKQYYRVPKGYQEKIEEMIEMGMPTFTDGTRVCAWPLDLLFEDKGAQRFVGYTMPRVQHCVPLREIFTPKSRQRNPAFAQWSYFHTLMAARNLAGSVLVLHKHGHVVGDLNDANSLCDARTRTLLIDADSFQILSRTARRVFTSGVTRPEYTAPELFGQSLQNVELSQHQDTFALAVLLFQLLTDRHPFDVVGGSDRANGYAEKIRDGSYPHCVNALSIAPASLARRVGDMPLSIRDAFERTFVAGHKDPARRVAALEWWRLLKDVSRQLTDCRKGHYYWSAAAVCAFCGTATHQRPDRSNSAERPSAAGSPRPSEQPRAVALPVTLRPKKVRVTAGYTPVPYRSVELLSSEGWVGFDIPPGSIEDVTLCLAGVIARAKSRQAALDKASAGHGISIWWDGQLGRPMIILSTPGLRSLRRQQIVLSIDEADSLVQSLPWAELAEQG